MNHDALPHRGDVTDRSGKAIKAIVLRDVSP